MSSKHYSWVSRESQILCAFTLWQGWDRVKAFHPASPRLATEEAAELELKPGGHWLPSPWGEHWRSSPLPSHRTCWLRWPTSPSTPGANAGTLICSKGSPVRTPAHGLVSTGCSSLAEEPSCKPRLLQPHPAPRHFFSPGVGFQWVSLPEVTLQWQC